MGLSTIAAMILTVYVGLISLSVYDLIMLVKHKPSQRYIAYSTRDRMADAIPVIIGTPWLLSAWFSPGNWTITDWAMTSATATYITLIMACATLANQQLEH